MNFLWIKLNSNSWNVLVVDSHLQQPSHTFHRWTSNLDISSSFCNRALEQLTQTFLNSNTKFALPFSASANICKTIHAASQPTTSKHHATKSLMHFRTYVPTYLPIQKRIFYFQLNFKTCLLALPGENLLVGMCRTENRNDLYRSIGPHGSMYLPTSSAAVQNVPYSGRTAAFEKLSSLTERKILRNGAHWLRTQLDFCRKIMPPTTFSGGYDSV